MKIALLGHGAMGRVLEETARAAGLEVGAIVTSANAADASRLLRGHTVAIDFSAPGGVLLSLPASTFNSAQLVHSLTFRASTASPRREIGRAHV